MVDNIIIKTENLSFSYFDGDDSQVGKVNEIPALSDVSLTVERGEYIAVLGHNGSGKSTLAKLLNVILTPTSGKIYISGVDITAPDFTEDDIFNIRQNPDRLKYRVGSRRRNPATIRNNMNFQMKENQRP